MSDTATATPKKRGRKPAQDKPSAPEREERVVWLPLGELHPFKGYPALRGIMPGNQPYHVGDDSPSMSPITGAVEERGIRRPGPVCGKVTQASPAGFFPSPGVLLLCGKAHIIKGT